VDTTCAGGYQYRLCPLKSNLTESCFQQTPVPFAGDSNLTLSNGTEIQLASKFVSNGTLPAGSTWQLVPIPSVSNQLHPAGVPRAAFQFPPPCYEPTLPAGLDQVRGLTAPSAASVDMF
jgi:hypothetical protein